MIAERRPLCKSEVDKVDVYRSCMLSFIHCRNRVCNVHQITPGEFLRSTEVTAAVPQTVIFFPRISPEGKIDLTKLFTRIYITN